MSIVEEGGRRGSAKGLGPWLARIAPRSARGTLAVAILPDQKVKALNRRYRGIDQPTDVLSFPDAGSGLRVRGVRPVDPPHLGDIVIARGIAQKQAKLLGHSLGTEFRVLALHGLLHLLGYDHDSDSGRMARAETRLRRKAGLPVGLIARSGRGLQRGSRDGTRWVPATKR